MSIALAGLDLQICPWIPETVDPLQLRICYLAHADIGIQEIPPGSNRSPYIDRIVLEAGGALGDYWCAAWAGHIWNAAGAKVPPKGLRMSCAEWEKWAKANGTWFDQPGYGYAIIYGDANGHAHHIGLSTRLSPIPASVEGNTTTGGSFSRNGTAVWPKAYERTHVKGFIRPLKAAA